MLDFTKLRSKVGPILLVYNLVMGVLYLFVFPLLIMSATPYDVRFQSDFRTGYIGVWLFIFLPACLFHLLAGVLALSRGKRFVYYLELISLLDVNVLGIAVILIKSFRQAIKEYYLPPAVENPKEFS